LSPHYEDKRTLLEAMVRANLDDLTGAREKAKRDQPSLFGALDRIVRAYFDFARRFPGRYRFLVEISHEDSPLGAEVRQAFEAVTILVRAAQQAGELRGGDAEQLSALIVGAAYGMADLAQFGPAPSPDEKGEPTTPRPISHRCCSTCWPTPEY